MWVSLKHMYSYLLSRFKLISIVVYVKDIDSYNWNIPIIVAPMYDASWQCNNISLFEAVNFLVLILKLLALALTLSKFTTGNPLYCHNFFCNAKFLLQ